LRGRNQAYSAENWTKDLSFDDMKEAAELAGKLQVALNAEVQLWADCEQKLVVFYGDKAAVDGIEIRGMLVTVQINDSVLHKLAGIEKPSNLQFL